MKSINEYLTPTNMSKGSEKTYVSKNYGTKVEMNTDLLEKWLNTSTEDDEEEVMETIIRCFISLCGDDKEKGLERTKTFLTDLSSHANTYFDNNFKIYKG